MTVRILPLIFIYWLKNSYYAIYIKNKALFLGFIRVSFGMNLMVNAVNMDRLHKNKKVDQFIETMKELRVGIGQIYN